METASICQPFQHFHEIGSVFVLLASLKDRKGALVDIQR